MRARQRIIAFGLLACLSFACLAFVCLALALPAQTAAADEADSIHVQNARAGWVKNKGYKVYYTRKFDLSALPSYKPEQHVSGTIRMWGSNYFTDSPLAEYWEKDFQRFQPNVTFDFHL